MKIAIDCADLDHGRIDGTRVYIKNLLDWFGRIDKESQFLLYHQKDFNPLLAPEKHLNYVNRKIPYKFCWTQTRFAFELRQDKPDVCWMPIQQIPFIGAKETKYVVTIHDLAFKIFPDHFPKKDIWKLNFFADTAIRRADKIIAISEATKKDILRFYPKVREEKVAVVHHGFDVERFSKRYSKEEIGRVLEKYEIVGTNYESRIMNYEKTTNHKLQTTNYLLYVGAIQPRKNLERLVDVFERLKEKEKHASLKLVLVGEPAWKAEAVLQRVEKSKNKKDIILTGKVDFEELAAIYQSASVFVFPSLYEGFGIPVLEAMASGVPVLAANNSSLPEVGGDAAGYFEANNGEEFFQMLEKILGNDIMKKEMIIGGAQRIAGFSWEKCARETLEVLKTGV